MLVLGLESTAHTFGAGIVTDKGNILSNIRKPLTTATGGIHPGEAAEHHATHCVPAVEEALLAAGKKLRDIDVISYSAAPGLGPSLQVGCFLARYLALKTGKPLVGVNHSIAHLEIGRLVSGFEDPLLLYVSGVNTQIICFESGKYRIMGETLDVGVGNFLDKLGRELGLGFPGGPKVAQLAALGSTFISLPYSIKGMDVSLGGLLTHVARLLEKKEHKPEDLCFSVQETVFAMVVEATERALAQTGKKSLVLGGGVACNTRLQEMCAIMCKERGVAYHCPKNEYLVDNAAMIAWLGVLKFKAGETDDPKTAGTHPYQRTDQVLVSWR